MDKKLALDTLISITNHNLGHTPTSPTEFNDLCWQIQKKTGRTISLSSIKRLWGYVSYDGFPAVTTLNILAQFNGYKSWASFLLSDAVNTLDSDSVFVADSVINADNLNVGDCLLLAWNSEKSCEIQYLDNHRFRVNKATNIKLKAGDTFTLHTISIGLPIYITDIIRGQDRIPVYIGAKRGGVASIALIPKQS